MDVRNVLSAVHTWNRCFYLGMIRDTNDSSVRIAGHGDGCDDSRG